MRFAASGHWDAEAPEGASVADSAAAAHAKQKESMRTLAVTAVVRGVIRICVSRMGRPIRHMHIRCVCRYWATLRSGARSLRKSG